MDHRELVAGPFLMRIMVRFQFVYEFRMMDIEFLRVIPNNWPREKGD